MTARRLFKAAILLILLAALACVAMLAFVAHETRAFIVSSAAQAPTSTAAMVLGASVYQNGTLSPILSARADRAIELYRLGKVKKILVTGDNGDLAHNEVNPVGNYLVARGIPKEDIFLDHAGFDTYSSMYRAREIFRIKEMLIVSQPFHLARAVYIARALGLTAYGVEAGGEPTPYNTLREVPATIKALADLYLKREPKYLGEQYPIEGRGNDTWADMPLSTTTASTTGFLH